MPLPGANIGDARRGDADHQCQPFLNDEFGLGPRHEDRRRNEELASPELAPADNVRGRLAPLAPFEPFREPRLQLCRRWFAQAGQERRPVPTENRPGVDVHVD
jgi:hypothetical protein